MAELFAVGGRRATASELAAIHILRGLPAAELSRLLRDVVPLEVAEGQVVIHEGDPADALYLVASGSFAAFRDAVGQPVHLLSRLDPGDFFGELGFFGDGKAAASVRASAAGRLLRIAAGPLLAFLDRHPDIHQRLQAASADRYSRLLATALELGRRREVRIKCSEKVQLRPAGGGWTPALLENLSLGGACIEGAPAAWREGDDVAFELGLASGELPLAGRISWREDDKVGLAFTPLDERHDAMIQMAIRVLLHGRAQPAKPT
jgi:CRP-like cAMP-binding protein